MISRKNSPSFALLERGRNCGDIGWSDRLALLLDAEQYFGALSDALERAERYVFFSCWDVDSRVVLKRIGAREQLPLRKHLDALVRKRPGLNIYFLLWDFAMIYTLEREHLPFIRFGWQTSPRIHFQLDNHHPLAASHHHKFVVVDDKLAFIGGIDITKGRWDTDLHLPNDPRRTDPDGCNYMPFHDIQIALDNGAAKILGELFRQRWRRVTNRTIETHKEISSDPWPPALEPDITSYPVGIAETRAAYKNLRAKREIRNLYLDIIAYAKRYIYIENQFLTTTEIVDALVERLSSDTCPEMVIVLPLKSEGWLEERTMNALRAHHLERLLHADTNGRVYVCYPHIQGLEEKWINVHSKLCIADDEIMTAGSANLSNRSMGLDSECNIVVEGIDERGISTIKNMKNRLLGHHLGVSPQRLEAELEKRPSMVETVKSFRGGRRSLVEIDIADCRESGVTLSRQELLDPERPTEFDDYVDSVIVENGGKGNLHAIVRIIAVVFVLVALVMVWHFTSLSKLLNPSLIARKVALVGSNPIAPIVGVGSFVLLGAFAFPVTVLFLATAIVFEPIVAVSISLIGCTLSATVTYLFGRLLGRTYVRRYAGDRVHALSKWIAKKGVAKMAIVRLIPTVPFFIVNFVAGASHIQLSHYVLGTAIGMLPGITLITFLGEFAFRALLNPSQVKMVLLVGISFVVALVTYWIYRRTSPYGPAKK